MFPTGMDFREMALHTTHGILIHEAASKNILWANPAACRMFGFTLEELRPLKAHHMSSPERQYRREVGVAWLQDAVNHGESRKRWKYRSKDGRNFLTDAVATLVRFADGPVVMVQFRGIAEEVAREAELMRTTDYLSRIMAHASAGILLLDDDGRVLDSSPFVSELFGRTPDQLVGRPLEALARVSAANGGGQPAPGEPGRPAEWQLEVAVHGATRWLSAQVESVEHDGIVSRMVAVRDITSRVEMQRENAHQQAHLQYLARYNAMGDMAMTIAHELGQPLAAASNFLSGVLSRLGTGRLSETDIRYGVQRALRQLTRTADIVASVKRYVQRIESPSARHDLNAIMAESLYFVGLRAADRGIAVESEYAEEELPITGEQILIGQVIINYCFNAIDEAALTGTRDKRILVRSFADGDWVGCSVLDWGRGLDQVCQEHGAEEGEAEASGNRQLVNAFSSKQDGSGIGLVLSERIVERHAGEVLVSDNDPSGTVITLRLPRAD
ncbi:PAS domain-containing sensor histidine kinase [Enemella evansiae]|uniref:PAS domain S-box protein n=1 Tax=Enemella evansiae TaxID=2016499 RepID=UPI000B9602C0|nr:PAS domain S-box protein [Enemella evansiae]OYO12403.1 PAS domain-containing sensor histidine kinase [Enemella evansiae]